MIFRLPPCGPHPGLLVPSDLFHRVRRSKASKPPYTECLLAFPIHECPGFIVQKERDLLFSPFRHAVDVDLHEDIVKRVQIPPRILSAVPRHRPDQGYFCLSPQDALCFLEYRP
jgi:hypothetical protein